MGSSCKAGEEFKQGNMKSFLIVLCLFGLSLGAPEAEADAVAEASPDADPWHYYGYRPYYGGYYGYRPHGYYGYGYYGRRRGKREAEASPVADPNADPEADPWYYYGYAHRPYYYGSYYRPYGYCGYGLYGRKKREAGASPEAL